MYPKIEILKKMLQRTDIDILLKLAGIEIKQIHNQETGQDGYLVYQNGQLEGSIRGLVSDYRCYREMPEKQGYQSNTEIEWVNPKTEYEKNYQKEAQEVKNKEIPEYELDMIERWLEKIAEEY